MDIDESIEFFNPGRLAGGLTAEQLTSGNYISAVRNKQIALIFKEAGLIEKYGSGIKRVLRAFNEYQLKAPVFEDFQHGFRVTVCRAPQKTPQKDEVKTKILDFLMENPYLSQREVAEKLLKKENRIKRMGGRKNGFWNVL